ncbi:MAG: hypothetical protein ACI8UO_004533 [Verrucomicrobiales bacterium]|jgi:hypothetical protein
MRRLIFTLAGILVLATCLTGCSRDKDEDETVGSDAEASPKLEVNEFGKAVAISKMSTAALSRITTETTSLAISPLFGMGALGVWQWWKADSEARAELPWYTNPWIWGGAFVIFGLAKWKDTFGVFVPELLKKPLQVIDIFEDKISAFIVMLAVIPLNITAAAGQFVSAAAEPSPGGPEMITAGVPPMLALTPMVVFVPFAILIFLVVWGVSHAVKCIMLLSPSSWLTLGVKVAKGVLLAIIAFVSSLSPLAGTLICLVLILICFPIYAWAFRWNVFGTLFAFDSLFSRSALPLKEKEELWGFVTSNFGSVKARSYGRIRREGDEIVFRYRPWLVFRAREVRMGVAERMVAIRRGILMPAVLLKTQDGSGETGSILDLRRRFRTHEMEIAPNLGAREVLPSRLTSKVQSSLAWLKSQMPGQETRKQIGV